MGEKRETHREESIQGQLFGTQEADAPPMPYVGPVRYSGDVVDEPDSDTLNKLPSLHQTRIPDKQHRDDKNVGTEIEEAEDEATNPNSKKTMVVGTAIAALLIAGGAFLFGGEDDEPVSARDTREQPSTPTDSILIPRSPTPQETERDPEYTPMLQISDDPATLIQQTNHNINCMFNAPLLEDAELCLAYTTADGSGALTDLLRQRMLAMRAYRETDDSNYKVENKVELIDSQSDYYEIQAIINQVTNEGESVTRWKFRRDVLVAGDYILNKDVDTNVWKLFSTETIEPGEPYFN